MCEGQIQTCHICFKMIEYEKMVYIPFDDSKPNKIIYEKHLHIRCQILERKRNKALDFLKKIEEEIEEERYVPKD